MSKKETDTTKKHFKILSVVFIIFGILTIISAIAFVFINFDLGDLHIEEVDRMIANADGQTNIVKTFLCFLAIVSGSVDVFKGWLLNRASKNPEKTTCLLVLTVLGLVSGFYAMATAGYTTLGNAVSNILNITLDTLAFLAVLNVRKIIS